MPPSDAIQQTHAGYNFRCHFIDGVFSLIGYSIFNAHAIMPGFIHELVVRHPYLQPYENRLVQTLVVLFVGVAGPVSFLTAGLSEHLTERKGWFLRWVFTGRFTVLAIALCTLAMGWMGATVFLTLLYSLVLVRAVAAGTSMPQWLDFIGRQIPEEKRGVLFGGRDAMGTLLGVAVLAALPHATKRFGFPTDFGLLFLAAAIAFLISGLVLSRMREVPYQAEETRPRAPLLQRLRRTLGILREDKPYRMLMIAMVFASMVTVANSSMIVTKANRLLGLAGPELTAFAGKASICQIASYAAFMPLMGLLAGRIGYKKLAYIGCLAACGTMLLGIFAGGEWTFLSALVIGGARQAAMVLIGINLPLALARSDRRPSYIGLRSLCMLPAAFMPLIGGSIADGFDPDIVLWAAAVFALLALVVFYLLVREPEQR